MDTSVKAPPAPTQQIPQGQPSEAAGASSKRFRLPTIEFDRQASWVRWAIAVTVSFAALLEVLDSSIVNVALPQIQGNLGCTLSEAGWIVTGYAVANAIIIPLTAWLNDLMGKRTYFIFSLIGFTIASMFCGISPNLTFLVVGRILQGLFGGALLAKAQAILFETFPPHEQASAQALFGICVMVGPVMGPTLGGFLTDALNWRWIFFVNLPFGIFAVIMSYIFLPKNNERKITKIDFAGIALLAATIGSLQTVLEEGQRDNWFDSPMIVILTIVAAISFVAFIWQELRAEQPAVNLRVLKHRALAAGVAYSLVLGIALYGAMFAVPVLAQTMFHYTAMQTGMMMLPGAIASTLFMPIMGWFSNKVDARAIIATGATISFTSMLMLAGVNPNTSADSIFWALVLRGAGSVLMFMPLSMVALGTLPKSDITAGAGLYNLMRQLGGSIGIAGLTTFLDSRFDFHRAVLVEHITSVSTSTSEYVTMFSGTFAHMAGLSGSAHTTAMSMLDSMVQVQAMLLSYSDCFLAAAAMFVISLPLLLCFGKAKGKEVAAH